jgi:hypothetical protein
MQAYGHRHDACASFRCGRQIAIGEIEYELVAGRGDEIRLDDDCYALLVKELVTIQGPEAAAG